MKLVSKFENTYNYQAYNVKKCDDGKF